MCIRYKPLLFIVQLPTNNIRYINFKLTDKLQILPTQWIDVIDQENHFPNMSEIMFKRPSNLLYKAHQIPKIKCFSFRLPVVFVQHIGFRS